MVKLRYRQETNPLNNEDGKTMHRRSLLSFPSFRRSSTCSAVPGERPISRLSRMSTSKEAVNSYGSLQANKYSRTQQPGLFEAECNRNRVETPVFGTQNPQCQPSLVVATELDSAETPFQCSAVSKAATVTTISGDKKYTAIEAALAFQRWRNVHLKNLFNQELNKVLEEAQKDEACLASMEQEILDKEQQLARAVADSAQLRAQLSTLNFANDKHNSLNEEEQRQQKELLEALERAKLAEANVERKDKEIIALSQKLQSLEDERCKTVATLEADIVSLQKTKDSSSAETQALIDQVSLYNELQKLQDLIVKEAWFHQERNGNQEKDIDKTCNEELGSNASPFSSSLWRICNGLAHCLIEARNQILALIGESKSRPFMKTSTLLKSYGIHSNFKICSKSLYEKKRVKFQRPEQEAKLKHEQDTYKKTEDGFYETTLNAEALDFVGTGERRRYRSRRNVVNSMPRKRVDRYLLSKRKNIGAGYASLIQSRRE